MNKNTITKIFKFTFVGGLVAVIDPSLLYLFHEKGSIELNTSITLAYFISVSMHFTLSNTYTFSNSKKRLNGKLVRYCIQVLICYILNLFIINLLLNLWLDQLIIAKFFAMSVCTVVSFFLMNYFVFPEGSDFTPTKISEINKWPKTYPMMTAEQVRIKDEWMKFWHEVLPNKYGIIERFNHGYPVRTYQLSQNEERYRTLEIGAGLGEHIYYEDLNGQDYCAMELRDNMAKVIKEKFQNVKVYVGDCQERLPFDNDSIDRIIAIHVLEHLPNLPNALQEIHRILNNNGVFQVVIPCEGGIAYSIARKISAERIFKKHFNMDYGWLIKTEHINVPSEIIEEINCLFEITKSSFFPLVLPIVNLDLVIGLNLKPKKMEDPS